MNSHSKILTGAAVLILFLFGSGALRAQDQTAPPDQAPPQDQVAPQDQGGTQDQNPPTMARISMIHGNVSTQRGDSGDITTATMNTPVAAGDKVMTGTNSRAEIQLDFANVLRLADSSNANIATLDARQIQIQIGEGLAYFSQFKGNEASVEIDTPNVAIQPAGQENSFSIFVNNGGQTEVTVRKGELELSTPQGSTRVRSGQMITVQGTGDNVQYKITDAPPKTDWDTFNQDRDRLIQHAESWKHTDRYYTGTQDLDTYGRWTEVPDYGQVWVPNQGPGWAPYSDGSWVWEPYWGWTWVSYEPWGWAPYHYGRWFVYGGGWAWWPGPIYGGFYRPIWAPAYVSFFGFGPGIGVGVGFGFGFGMFGWLPIGPGDFFHPWWGGYRDHFGVVNITNIHDVNSFHGGWAPLHGGDRFSNLRNVWTNDRIRQGLSTVPANSFGRGPAHVTPASLDTLRNARGMTGNLPVVPSRDSLSASGKFQSSGSFGSRGGTQSFFSKQTPAARTESFSAQASHLQNAITRDGHFSPVSSGNTARNTMEGRSNSSFGSGAGEARGNTAEPNRPAVKPADSNSPASARSSGFADRPNSSVSGSSGTRTQAPASNGWQRFGSANGGNGSVSRPSPSTGSTNQPWRAPSSGSVNSNARSNVYSPNENGGSQRYSSPSYAPSSRPESSQPSYRPPTSGRPSSTYRPPLQMNRPIVTPRSYGNNGNYGRSGNTSRAPSYPSGGSRAPSGGGSRSESHPSSHSSGGSHGGSGGHSHGH